MAESAIFMKVAGVTGESQNAAYKQWTDVISVSQTIRSTRKHGATGPAISSAEDLTCTALLDNAAPALFQKCANGTNIAKVEFAFIKMGNVQWEYMRYTLEDVYVSSYRQSGNMAEEGGHPVVEYGFNFARMKVEYKQQTEKGSTGGASSATWDIKQNKP